MTFVWVLLGPETELRKSVFIRPTLCVFSLWIDTLFHCSTAENTTCKSCVGPNIKVVSEVTSFLLCSALPSLY